MTIRPGEGWRGELLGILGGGGPPGLNPDPDPFSDLSSRKLCHHYLKKNPTKKDFLKSTTNSYISLSFLFIWNWKR